MCILDISFPLARKKTCYGKNSPKSQNWAVHEKVFTCGVSPSVFLFRAFHVLLKHHHFVVRCTLKKGEVDSGSLNVYVYCKQPMVSTGCISVTSQRTQAAAYQSQFMYLNKVTSQTALHLYSKAPPPAPPLCMSECYISKMTFSQLQPNAAF